MRTHAARGGDGVDRVRYAKVLVELGCLLDAEHEVAEALYESPDDTDALALFTKIKHIRGELSSAIAGWSELHARARRHAPTARLRLLGLLHMAQAHEAVPAAVDAAPARVMRKPVVYAELEEAFRAWLSHRPWEARARCRMFALRTRALDAELYKLAVLAEAWMAEQAGDLVSARALLEALGRERTYTADLDRVLALAPLYERIGTREALEAATHIYRFLARSVDSFMAYGHLTDLYRRLGDEESARRAERAHVAELRARMLRPSLAEAAAVAARRYLPLPLLADAALPDDDVLPAEPRARGVVHALRGELDDARRCFDAGGERLDDKYRADLDVLAGNDEAALSCTLALAREDPADLWLAFRLLDVAHERPHEQARQEIASHFRVAPHATLAHAALSSRIEADPRDGDAWRRLATLDALAPGAGGETGLNRAARASIVVESELTQRHAVGRALAASVYAFPGGAREGLIHEIWAGKEPVEPGSGGTLSDEHIFGNLTPEMHKDVKSTFLAVREWARAKLPHRTSALMDFRYTYKVTKEDEPSGGASAGLPTALAFLSVFLEEPLPQDLASTGRIVTDAHDVLTVHGIGDVAHKARAACHRNLRALVAPSMNRAELFASPLVPRAVSAEVVRFVSSFDDAVRIVFGARLFA